MNAIQLGLSLAAVILYGAKLLNYARDPAATSEGDRLRRLAWVVVAIAMVFLYSPVRIAGLLGHPFDPPLPEAMRLIGLALMVVAAVIGAAARGYLRGGTRGDVLRGLAANTVVVVACVGAGAALA